MAPTNFIIKIKLEEIMLNPNNYTSISELLKAAGWTEDQTVGVFRRGTDFIPFKDIGKHTPQTFAKSVNPAWLEVFSLEIAEDISDLAPWYGIGGI